MTTVTLVFAILTTYICFANGQAPCNTPNDVSGVCKSVYECPSMLDLIKKPDKTEEEIELLKMSKCGFEENTPKVCCPTPCHTPHGKEGMCVSIFACPRLANLLRPPVPAENKLYVQNSKCTGKDKYSVCCGPAGYPVEPKQGNCAATITAFPPDPSTECCGIDASAGNKIIGGGNTLLVDQYPWLVIIEYIQANKTKLLCGGALISGRYVVTAAHCVVGDVLKAGTPTNVRLGEYNTTNDGQDCMFVEANGVDCTDGTIIIPIERIIAHPDYNPTKKPSPNDIALIRLQQSAPYTDFIRPICLPTSDITVTPPMYFSLFAAGWGTVSTSQPSSPVKLQAELPFVSRNVCEPACKSGGSNFKLTSGQMCAGGIAGKDSCKGDSGGPLMFVNVRSWEVIGIFSFGPTPCGLPDVPGVYTKVYEYVDWIRSVIVA